MTDDLTAWATLSSEYEIDLSCVYFMGEADLGVEGLSATLKILGDRGIKLGLRVYAPENHGDSSTR